MSLRILQIVTLITPDGAFGGPVRVALNQSKELISRGHSVVVVAGAMGFDGPIPLEMDGVPLKLFKVRNLIRGAGFAGLISLKYLIWLMRNVSSFDVVHVHMARDMITTPAAAMATFFRRSVFIQTHGMIDSSAKWQALLLDYLIVRRSLRNAKQIYFLTESERAAVLLVESHANMVELLNGVPTDIVATAPQLMPPVDPIEVLMVARLHAIKRPDFFVKMAAQLSSLYPEVRFSLVGPDGGEGQRISELIVKLGVESTVIWEGSVAPDLALDRMRKADLFVLPSESEVMPMSALEAMSVGVPVVLCRPCGIADAVIDAGAGLIADQSLTSLSDAVSTLLSDALLREKMGKSARELVESGFSIGKVVDRLESHYR